MIDVYSKALKAKVSIDRIIGKVEGVQSGPTIVFVGGMHGNEPSGIFALEKILKKIDPKNVKGTVYGFAGNLLALSNNVRFQKKDLNRLWTKDNIEKITLAQKELLLPDEKELLELYSLLTDIINKHTGPFYFIDFHTTSSKTLPFITINDALINRNFSKQFPVPIVLGLEEYLTGPMLSYINELGYVSLGFESGQHDEKSAIDNSIAFAWLTLVFSGCINSLNVPEFDDYLKQLQKSAMGNSFIYEIIDCYKISENEEFKMLPDLNSFENISRGTKLAQSNGQIIKSKKTATLFMPLYQKQGDDGYFIIKKIPKLFLKLSTLVRNSKLDALLTFLPGISWETNQKETLLVNLKIARFLTKPLFHLLGYRNRQLDENYIKMNNRERAAKKEMYKNEKWYKNYSL